MEGVSGGSGGGKRINELEKKKGKKYGVCIVSFSLVVQSTVEYKQSRRK